ncbi:MAG: type II toxin-antitoxin system HipA family toxin [Alcanivoracaceae bacterium]
MASSVAEVYLWGLQVGAVAWDSSRSLASFEYTSEFFDVGIELAPLKMPIGRQVYSFPALNKETFRGLPGMLADSLPDKYGDALINSWLARQGRSPGDADPVERLCFVGRRGMGALEYRPAKGAESGPDEVLRIDELVRISDSILSDRASRGAILHDDISDEAMRQIVHVGSSAGGARAKAIIQWNPETGEVRSGQVNLRPGFEHWMLKLDGITHSRDKESSYDPRGYGIREYVYYEMAKAAGLEMTECRLLMENGRSHFMTRRFDREGDGGKLVMQSLCAIGHYDYNVPGSCGYDELFQLMQQLGLDATATREQFRRMVFNVLGCNRDDHTKNIAFLMDKSGVWSLSPAFDITFAWNPTGSWTNGHQMTINGRRDNISRDDLISVGKRAGLSTSVMGRIIDQVRTGVAQFPALASQHGLPGSLVSETEAGLAMARQQFGG